MSKPAPTPHCQCAALMHLLNQIPPGRRLTTDGHGGNSNTPLNVPAVRCAVCVGAITEAKNELVRENAGLRKAEALLRAGMGSQAEEMDRLKQEVRRLQGMVEGMAGRVVAQSKQPHGLKPDGFAAN